jgi:phosphoadenosine phosphosulfate reductase
MRALAWDPVRALGEPALLDEINSELERMDAAQRVQWALHHLPGEHALSSSFGAQAAVSLHMVTRAAPSVPVILIDTGYLFPETYRFVDDLVERLELNLKVYQPRVSPAWL